MATSARLLMTLLTEGQASGEITANECLKILDALMMHRAIERANSNPAGVEGDLYLVGPSAIGGWTGQDNKLAVYVSGAWRYIPPSEGWVLWVRDTTGSNAIKTYLRYTGSAWVSLFPPIEPPRSQRVFSSGLPTHATGFLLVSGTAYFVYLGRTTQDVIPQYVEFHCGTAGAGAQTAEIGLFSSPLGPNANNQSLTKLVSTGTLQSLTSTGVKYNTNPFSTTIPANTHLWAGLRTAMATTQPTIESLCRDMAHGEILSTAGASALTGAGPWTGSIIGAATGQIGPDLRATLD